MSKIVGWMHEDELPENYPYDAMYPHSVVDGVRIFPIFGPPEEARTLAEYHDDFGFVTWWKFPVDEPSYIGSPNCEDWPGYHTHWTPHPPTPKEPKT